MAGQPCKDPARNAMGDEASKGYQGSNGVNSKRSHARSGNSASPPVLQGSPIPEAEEIQSRYILARAMPLYTRNGHDYFYRSLQQDIWCLVKTENDTFDFELLSECQKKMKTGEAKYEDLDWGKGIHPSGDKAWVWAMKACGLWSETFYDVKTAVRLEKTTHFTALLSAKGPARELLRKIRKECHYTSDELVRVPLYMLPKNVQDRYRGKVMEEAKNSSSGYGT